MDNPGNLPSDFDPLRVPLYSRGKIAIRLLQMNSPVLAWLWASGSARINWAALAQMSGLQTVAGALRHCRLSPQDYSSFYRPAFSEALISNGEVIRFPSGRHAVFVSSKNVFILGASFHGFDGRRVFAVALGWPL